MSNVKKRYLMPRPRKYDYKKDYPVKFFVKVPVDLANELDSLGYKQQEIEKMLEPFVKEYLTKFVEKSKKID